jgi:hypothetical protein
LDAARWSEFLRAARQVWQTAHLRRSKHRGRPLVESELTAIAYELVKVARRAGKEPKQSLILKQLGDRYPDRDDSTLRRHVKLALIESKPIPALTDKDKQFLYKRRRTLFRMLHEFKCLIPSLIQRVEQYKESMADTMERIMSNLTTKIQQDFPDHYSAAEASGPPLNFAEIERLYEEKAQHKTLTFQMLRP